MHVAICGGGVIGAALAYELSRRSVSVTVIECWRVAGAASGKSGGFLARDWCDGTPVAELAQRSFDLHEDWADALGNPYGYRKVDTFGGALSIRRRLRAAIGADVAQWLAGDVVHRSRLGSMETTAQLDPEAFTVALMDGAVANGCTLHIGTVTGLKRSGDGTRATGFLLQDGHDIAADCVVLAMGPWSTLAADWVELPPVYGLKGHSVVFKPDAALPPEAAFLEFEDDDGAVVTPEIVSRADGTVYVCGLSGAEALPPNPSSVEPEKGGCEKLQDVAIRLVPRLGTAEVVARQACYRPVSMDGLPIVGAIPGLVDAYVATGHSVWGMLNAPGTAEALAEMITGGESTHVDLTPFAPSRYMSR